MSRIPRPAIAFLISGSSAALAQMNITVNGESDTTHAPYALSTNNCNASVRIAFTLPNGACQNSASIFVTLATSCPTSPGSGDVQVPINADGVSANTTVSSLATFKTGDARTLQRPQQFTQLDRVSGTYHV